MDEQHDLSSIMQILVPVTDVDRAADFYEHVLALAASFVVTSPAVAQDLNPWGVWGDGSQMKKGKADSADPQEGGQ